MRSTRSGEVILGKKGGWREESFISLVLPFKNNKIKSVNYFYNPIFYLKKNPSRLGSVPECQVLVFPDA